MNTLSMAGTLSIRKGRVKKAPLIWALRNAVRWSYVWGWLTTAAAKAFSKITGIVTITTELRVIRNHCGVLTDYGVVGRRCITTVGVNFLVDAWQNSVELEIMKYHLCGIGTTAEAIGDTTLVSACTTVLNPDTTKATGTLAEGATNNIFSSVGTLTFDGNAAVTEHGLFSQAAAGGTLWDRTVFAAINVVDTDTLQFTYQCTFTAGG
jgi:hypothetical protein